MTRAYNLKSTDHIWHSCTRWCILSGNISKERDGRLWPWTL